MATIGPAKPPRQGKPRCVLPVLPTFYRDCTKCNLNMWWCGRGCWRASITKLSVQIPLLVFLQISQWEFDQLEIEIVHRHLPSPAEGPDIIARSGLARQALRRKALDCRTDQSAGCVSALQ